MATTTRPNIQIDHEVREMTTEEHTAYKAQQKANALAQDTLQIHPAVGIGLASAIPILINWLNPGDPRYGKVTDETRSE
jgi:hypothetical protein